MSSLLSKKAVLASVNISQWCARRLDREITDKVNDENNASKDAGRYNKLLIDKDALAPIQKIVGEARALHVQMTQPWIDNGPRLLPAAIYLEYANKFRDLRNDFNRAVETFAKAYPDHVKKRKAQLNGMFRESDYPSPSEIRQRFSFGISIMPCPDAKDFRVDIAEEHAADIRAEIEERVRQAIDDAMRDTKARILETVGHMASRLRAYKPATKKGQKSEGTFRDSLVENVRDLARLLQAFNLTDDVKLKNIAESIERDLCKTDADTLRDSQNAREKVAAAAEKILADVNSFMA